MKYVVLLVSISFYFTMAAGQNVPDIVQVKITGGYPTQQFKKTTEKNISELFTALSTAYKNNDESPDLSGVNANLQGKDEILDIWESFPLYCTKGIIQEPLIKTKSGYQIRNIQVSIDNDIHEVVLDLNPKGAITNMNFSVSEHQYKNIIKGNDVVDETRKKIILNFLEVMKTAYMKKDTAFIRNIFSDEALIIVGRKVQKAENSQALKAKGNKDTFHKVNPETAFSISSNVVYTKMTKNEYLNNLNGVFKRNKSVYVGFEDIEVYRNNKDGYHSYYGVELKQDWRTDSYKDYGYLFLLMEFREGADPLIWVRSWQDINAINPNDAINMGDFTLPSSQNKK